ncbi:6687_t:CDS:1 [Paraglomus occultum]|uniref:6687_t:CDS:1 n=1 Tax=Paraglomus occultum TaxID=144539 RepID=A0A9N9DHG6_9GLOM|nr:6687_t:CDS:1 [Paraglomus occultum]
MDYSSTVDTSEIWQRSSAYSLLLSSNTRQNTTTTTIQLSDEMIEEWKSLCTNNKWMIGRRSTSTSGWSDPSSLCSNTIGSTPTYLDTSLSPSSPSSTITISDMEHVTSTGYIPCTIEEPVEWQPDGALSNYNLSGEETSIAYYFPPGSEMPPVSLVDGLWDLSSLPVYKGTSAIEEQYQPTTTYSEYP